MRAVAAEEYVYDRVAYDTNLANGSQRCRVGKERVDDRQSAGDAPGMHLEQLRAMTREDA
ncbi:hypothetical protein D3C83_148380 [compost metagenome]